MPPAMTVDLSPLFEALAGHLASVPRITTLTGGAGRVAVEGGQSARDPVPEGSYWARVVVVPVVRLTDLQLATWRRVTFLVRTETGDLPDPNFKPAIVLEAMQRAAREALMWFEPRRLDYIIVTFPVHPTRDPEPQPRYHDATSSWYLSSEWSCEVDSRPLHEVPGITSPGDWLLVADPANQDPALPQFARAEIGFDGFVGDTTAPDPFDSELDLSDPPRWKQGQVRRFVQYPVGPDWFTDPLGFTILSQMEFGSALTAPPPYIYNTVFALDGVGLWTDLNRGFHLTAERDNVTGGGFLQSAVHHSLSSVKGEWKRTAGGTVAPGRRLCGIQYDPSAPYGSRVSIIIDDAIAATTDVQAPGVMTEGVMMVPPNIHFHIGSRGTGASLRAGVANGWTAIRRGLLTAAELQTMYKWSAERNWV